jgi:antitoxin HigA-1
VSLGITQYQLAKAIHVPQLRVREVVRGQHAMSADIALGLERFFGVEAQFWLNLQNRYDLEVAGQKIGTECR